MRNLYTGTGSYETSSALADESFMEENEAKFILITPKSPSYAKDNPFATAQLNDLTGKIRKQRRVGGGGFADVYLGLWVTDIISTKVAVKQLRSHIYNHADIPKLEKRLRKEMRIWANLDHPNIVSLFGITSDFGNCTAMVSRWMNQGKLSEYLKEKGNLNLQERLNICIAIAHGLSYLHSQKVIHGDLTPANILMDSDVAHLSDFGLSNVIAELQGPSFLTSMVGGSARWIAPELLLATDNTTPELTMACDVYSFASVACYVVTGILPYEHLKTDIAIILEILKSGGKSPSRQAQSELLMDEFWEILTMCWATDRTTRPEIDDVLHRLQQLKYF
ncbi:kinase-like domain-containing protein [Pholiota molesta]|nr:kinase-like domain-containing protein [Pholiota molesta]